MVLLLSPARLILIRHLGRFGIFPVVTINGPNTSHGFIQLYCATLSSFFVTVGFGSEVSKGVILLNRPFYINMYCNNQKIIYYSSFLV